jgi:hypothetical protein
MNSVGNGSYNHATFNFLKSMHILIPLPCFVSCTTIGLIHSDSLTGSIMSVLSIRSISSLTFCLYMLFILYGHCLIGLDFRSKRYLHLSQFSCYSLHLCKCCRKQVTIFMQQLCDAFYYWLIPIISNVGHIGMLSCFDVNYIYLDWCGNNFRFYGWSLHISFTFCFFNLNVVQVIFV